MCAALGWCRGFDPLSHCKINGINRMLGIKGIDLDSTRYENVCELCQRTGGRGTGGWVYVLLQDYGSRRWFVLRLLQIGVTVEMILRA